MNAQELYQNYFAACVNYVFLTNSAYPTTSSFVVLSTFDYATVNIEVWNDTSPQPSNVTLQSYTVAQVQAALRQFYINMGNITLIDQTHDFRIQDLTDVIPFNIGSINNIENNIGITIHKVQSLSYMESDYGGYSMYLYDRTRSMIIASDYFTNQTLRWNDLTVLNQLPMNSDVIIDVHVFRTTDTTAQIAAYVDGVNIVYYYG